MSVAFNVLCFSIGISGLWDSTKQCKKTLSTPEGSKSSIFLFLRRKSSAITLFSHTLSLSRLLIMLVVIHSVQTQYRVVSLDAGCLVLDRWISSLEFILKIKILRSFEIIVNILSTGFDVYGLTIFLPSVEICIKFCL